MPVRVERDPDFVADLRAQLAYLVERGEVEWITTLSDDLAQAVQVLAGFPDAGRQITRTGRPSVRRLRLRHAPYVVWYTAGRDRVVLQRLFHVRQKGPVPPR